MKINNLTGFLVILTILIPGILFARGATTEPDNIRLGVSRVNITPGKPAMMSGYAARETPSIGVNDSIYASAFYFTGDNNQILLITVDLIGFSFSFVEEARNLISSATGIPFRNIMLVAVHNHAGPSTGDHGPASVGEYTSELKGKLVNLAIEASGETVPVRIGVGKGTCTMNINRRAEFSKGEIWLGRNQYGPCDHDLSVVKFETLDYRPLAILINWPCHATSTGDSNYLISGDWPGAAARYIREHAGEGVIVGVTAGASGDINPIYGPGNVFREVEAIGYHVGAEALRVMGQMKTYPVNTLQATEKMVEYPGKMRAGNHFPQASFEPGPPVSIRLSAFKIGTLVLAGVSGELFTEIGMEIKKQSPYSETVVLTHANGSSGYIITDSSYALGGYEVQVTRLMPGAEKPLISSFMDIFHSFK
jgi:neutral ceramidase